MAETVPIDDPRIDLISQRIVEYANANFNNELPISEKRDGLDSIICGINLLGEELQALIEKTRQREEELKEYLDRLNEAQRLSQIGSWEWDIVNNKIEWSDELYRLYGVKQNDFDASYEKYVQLIHPEDRDVANEIVQKAYGNLQPFDFYHRLVRPDGEIRILHSRGRVFANSQGRAVKMSGTAQDVTREKESEERLKKYTQDLEYKNKETEQFSYVASHDLQEPLRTITNYINLFSEDYKGKLDESADMYIGFISGAASRMQTLIHDLLEYNRLENDMQLELVDCNALLKEVIQNLAASIEHNNAIVQVGPLPSIEGYRTRLNSLFQNLVNNAIKFRKNDVSPVIIVKAEDKGSDWLFSIEDNGIGIEKEYYQKIFKLFQKLHSRDEYQGTGIGLAQCKKIVELRGGKIWVESKFGQGATFYISLPKKYVL